MDETTGRTERFIRDINEDLASGNVSFPTYAEAALRIRRMADEPDLSAESLSRAVAAEPLLAAKLIRLANSAALHPSGPPVTDVRTALVRAGFAQVKALAIAVAVDQLRRAKKLDPVQEIARRLWEHSVNVAALACVLARKLTRLNPDSALYAGIVHDIGQFYLLSRVVDYPELLDASDDLSSLMFALHKAVGRAVLESLDTPEEIIVAVDDHEIFGNGFPPETLGDVLFIANQTADSRNPFSTLDEYSTRVMREAATFGWDRALVEEIATESRAEMRSIMAALHA